MKRRDGYKTMVHIRKVEIFGFKSFGFRNTVVDFRPGLVSISGPNGSGKSNILDAIIFASGEMRPKVMRVDKIRSLIHDVSSSGGGSRMARVSVHFENGDRKIPVDSDAVEITRELTAGGENTYYVNKKKTQRMHVIDLLEMANAGLHQLNAVQQGTVTRISEFSAEEKRRAIEDLVGMSAFDEKKTAAQKQLEAADNKLNVALATMGQIKKQIDDLEEQRNLQMRHDFLDTEMSRMRAVSAAGKLSRLASQKAQKSQALESLLLEAAESEKNAAGVRAEIASVESEKSGFLSRMDEYNREKAGAERQLSAAVAEYEETRARLTITKKRILQIGERTEHLEAKSRKDKLSKADAESKARGLGDSLAAAEKEKAGIDAQVREADAVRAGVLQKQSAEYERRKSIDSGLQELTAQLHGEELAALNSKSGISDRESRAAANGAKLDQCVQNIQRLQRLKASVESIREGHRRDAGRLDGAISSLRAKREAAERDLADLETILEKSSKAGARYDSKIRTVKSLMHEDYSAAKLKERAAELGIVGLVYELLSWDSKYERAVMASGSEWIRAIVVRDFETLVALAEHAKRQNLPKVRIIPLDALSAVRDARADGPEVLSGHIACKKEHEHLRAFLFGNVALASSRGDARRISESGYRSVTLGGELFESRSSAVVIDINSRISKIANIISMSMSVKGLLESVSVLKRHASSKKAAIRRAGNSIADRGALLHASKAAAEKAQESCENLDANIKNALSLRESLKERAGTMAAERESLEADLRERGRKSESIKSEIASLRASRGTADVESELQKSNETKSALEARHSEVMGRYRRISSEGAMMDAQVSRRAEEMRMAAAELESLSAERSERAQSLDGLESTCAEQNAALVALREGEQRMISAQGGSASDLEEYDGRIREMRGREESHAAAHSRAVRRSDALKRDLGDISGQISGLQKILGAYGTRVEFDEEYDPEPLLRGLEAEQRSLGTLNATAPATYVQISGGYRSMSTRKNRLEGERNSIVRFIEEVERDKRQTFLDAFDIVDKQVRTTFSKMTGGSAWLELENEDDIFSSGISYILQFANKPKRESASISGGEKTLAAIVFVLALQKLKPSPFYLFDEVDAHLDAPNAERLSRILEERSRESQFIMVSLKDSVVSKASLIYGVYPRRGDAASQVVRYKDKRLPTVQQKA